MRGQRYVAPPGRGRRRVALLGVGLIAAMSLVWQQQATLATFSDAEVAGASFQAASTLPPITPEFTTTATTASGTWLEPAKQWATTNYVLTGSTSQTGADPVQVYSGPINKFVQSAVGPATTESLKLTDISAGGTHACGIARGQLYCWGSSSAGALGLGNTSPTSTPTVVNALVGKVVTDVSAGAEHTCAVAGGAVYCWGNFSDGRLGIGPTTANVTTPTAVKTIAGVLAGRPVTAISAGGSHTCAVAERAVYCWGKNSNGQLGNSSTTGSDVPVAVTSTGNLAGRTVTAVSAGTSHSCAIADGLAFCWGVTTNGRVGNGATAGNQTSPVAVTAATGFLSGRAVTAISAGDMHTCAVADGFAYCWGAAASGRLGNGSTTTDQSSPVAVTAAVTPPSDVTAISAGATHSCAIAGGKALCWGAGASGQLGNGTSTASASAVVVTASGVLNGRTLATISAGNAFSCTNGDTPGSCWGQGAGGQLGNKASTSSNVAVGVAVTGPVCAANAVRLDDGNCSLEQGATYYAQLDYTVGSWTATKSELVPVTMRTRGVVSPTSNAKTSTSLTLGWDQVSELEKSFADFKLERSTSSTGTNPVTVYRGGMLTALDRGGLAKRTSNLAVSQVSAGAAHTCGIVEEAAYCWGDNSDGELGDGSTTNRPTPKAVVATGVMNGKTVTRISASLDNSDRHTCAVADGAVYCWGSNNYGELGNGTLTDSTQPVAVTGISDVTDVAVGYKHTCALTSGSKMYCWGENGSGQVGDGTAVGPRRTPVLVQGLLVGKTVTAIAAGGTHTCAVATDAVVCWGANDYGQLGTGSLSTTAQYLPTAVNTTGILKNLKASAVATGEAHTCAVAGGKAYCWGQNANGQLGAGNNAPSAMPVAIQAPWVTGSVLSGLTASRYNTCLQATGKPYCWGDNRYGQVGDNTQTTRTAPVAVSTGILPATTEQISTGRAHTCAVANGAAYCWGRQGAEGRLGNNSTASSPVPVQVQGTAGQACSGGATLITPMTCSLKSATSYYYRLTYTVDGGMSKSSGWIEATTA